MPDTNLKNGAYCNDKGSIYLRIVSLDTSNEWALRAVDHGISIAEAHCIAAELMVAIQEASRMATGRPPAVAMTGEG